MPTSISAVLLWLSCWIFFKFHQLLWLDDYSMTLLCLLFFIVVILQNIAQLIIALLCTIHVEQSLNNIIFEYHFWSSILKAPAAFSFSDSYIFNSSPRFVIFQNQVENITWSPRSEGIILGSQISSVLKTLRYIHVLKYRKSTWRKWKRCRTIKWGKWVRS